MRGVLPMDPYADPSYLKKLRRLIGIIKENKDKLNVYVPKRLLFFKFAAHSSGTMLGQQQTYKYSLLDMLRIFDMGSKMVEELLGHKRGRLLFIGNRGASSAIFVKFAKIAGFLRRKYTAFYTDDLVRERKKVKGIFDTLFMPLISFVKITKHCNLKEHTHEGTWTILGGDYVGESFYRYALESVNGNVASFYAATECPAMGIGFPERDEYVLFPAIYIPTIITESGEIIDILPENKDSANNTTGELAVTVDWNGFRCIRYRLGDIIKIKDFPYAKFIGRTTSAPIKIVFRGIELTIRHAYRFKVRDLWFNSLQIDSLPYPTIALVEEKGRNAIFFVNAKQPSIKWISALKSIAYGFYQDAVELGIMKIYTVFDPNIFEEFWSAVQRGRDQATVSRIIITESCSEIIDAISEKIKPLDEIIRIGGTQN